MEHVTLDGLQGDHIANERVAHGSRGLAVPALVASQEVEAERGGGIWGCQPQCHVVMYADKAVSGWKCIHPLKRPQLSFLSSAPTNVSPPPPWLHLREEREASSGLVDSLSPLPRTQVFKVPPPPAQFGELMDVPWNGCSCMGLLNVPIRMPRNAQGLDAWGRLGQLGDGD